MVQGHEVEAAVATIEKRERKDGTVYLVDIRLAGYPRQKKTFRRLTDAKLWASRTEAEIRDGSHRPINAAAKRKTFSDVLDRYERDTLPHLAKSTQRAAQTYLRYWREALGRFALSYITPDLIADEMRKLSETPDQRIKGKEARPKSRKTLKHYRDTLEVALKSAQNWGWLGSNPMSGVDRVTRIRNERDRYLADDERASLLHECRISPNTQLYPIVIFALSTGARKGEILGLSLADVNLARGVAILRDTKNGETRSVPIVGHLRDILADHIAWVNERYDEIAPETDVRWLFPRRDLLAPVDIRKAWENALTASGVQNFRFHDLRHSTASYLAMQGASLLEIADMLGHKTLQMVRRYAHLSEGHKSKLAERIDRQIMT
ncbi:conserved hypothetical protein [Hoeflea sp. EC-HK425]|mgnify:CR=1 FL=1|nr:conserved hypothetical protein [Hoeflea sp. EC-HK425]